MGIATEETRAEICEALGIDPKDVYELILHLVGSDVAELTIRRCVDRNDARGLRIVLEKYRLVEK